MSFPDHHPESPAGPRVRPVRVRERAPTFGTNSRFQVELRRRVDAYFERSGRRQRDCWQMYLKTAILVACFVVSYVLLVFVDQTPLCAFALAILLGLSAAASASISSTTAGIARTRTTSGSTS